MNSEESCDARDESVIYQGYLVLQRIARAAIENPYGRPGNPVAMVNTAIDQTIVAIMAAPEFWGAWYVERCRDLDGAGVRQLQGAYADLLAYAGSVPTDETRAIWRDWVQTEAKIVSNETEQSRSRRGPAPRRKKPVPKWSAQRQ